MPDNIQSGFHRGVLSLVILALLDREDMYGYQLVQRINTLSGGSIVTQEGSLYPVLYKLQEQGLISDEQRPAGKRMKRIYYHLEPPGRERLEALRREYIEVTRGVMNIITGEGHRDEDE